MQTQFLQNGLFCLCLFIPQTEARWSTRCEVFNLVGGEEFSSTRGELKFIVANAVVGLPVCVFEFFLSLNFSTLQTSNRSS